MLPNIIWAWDSIRYDAERSGLLVLYPRLKGSWAHSVYLSRRALFALEEKLPFSTTLWVLWACLSECFIHRPQRSVQGWAEDTSQANPHLSTEFFKCRAVKKKSSLVFLDVLLQHKSGIACGCKARKLRCRTERSVRFLGSSLPWASSTLALPRHWLLSQ